MKFLIFKMLIILGLLISMPLIYMGKFDPVGYFDELVNGGMSGFSSLKAKVPQNLTSVVSNEKVQVYKWRDKNGVMQFSNTPPPEHSNAIQVELDTGSNVMQAVKIPPKEEPKAVAKAEKPNPYSLKGAKKVMDDAKGVQDMLNKRHEDQLKMLDDI